LKTCYQLNGRTFLNKQNNGSINGQDVLHASMAMEGILAINITILILVPLKI
jgi:hypothetical protein